MPSMFAIAQGVFAIIVTYIVVNFFIKIFATHRSIEHSLNELEHSEQGWGCPGDEWVECSKILSVVCRGDQLWITYLDQDGDLREEMQENTNVCNPHIKDTKDKE